MPIQKSLETYLMILISMSILKKSGNLFNVPGINVPIRKKSGNLFNDPCINKLMMSGKLFNDHHINIKKSGNLFNKSRI